MSNVVMFKKAESEYGFRNLKLVEPKKKKINFEQLNLFKKLRERYMKRQDDIRKMKIAALEDAAYDFYLDYYLTHTKGTINIHETLYRNRIAVCEFAKNSARLIVMQRVEEGLLDDCYKALQRELKRKDREAKALKKQKS